MKNIRLTESDLHNIVNESVNMVLEEGGFFNSLWKGAKGAFNGAKQGYNTQQLNNYQNKNANVNLLNTVQVVRNDIAAINQSGKGMYANALNNKNPQGVNAALNNINANAQQLSKDVNAANQTVNNFMQNQSKIEKYSNRLQPQEKNSNTAQTVGGNATQQPSNNGWTRDGNGNYVNKQNNEMLSPYDYHMKYGKEFSPSREYNNRRKGYNPFSIPENRLVNGSLYLTESELHEIINEAVSTILEDININPKNKGKFTATQKKTGKSTEELCHSKNPLTRKRANFAKMAKRHWKPLKESVFETDLSGEYTVYAIGEYGYEPYNVIIDESVPMVMIGDYEVDEPMFALSFIRHYVENGETVEGAIGAFMYEIGM